MCEQVGLYGRALQFTTNAQEAQRIMLNSHAIPKEIMIEFFGKLSEEDSVICLQNLMRSNRQNGPLVAEIAVKYASKIDTKKSIEILEQYGNTEGLLVFLCNVLPHTDDPDIYFKYIESCARMGNFKEVERVVRETTFYDPVKVRDFLMNGKFSDPRPLIYLCNIHNFIEELTKYLYNTKQTKCIDIFLFKVNTDAAPKVLGTLLDLDCDENYIKALLNSLR
jgi:clathrin heavy chain